MMQDKVLTDEVDGVGIITLNRPESLNALDNELSDSFTEAVEQMNRSRSVRCLVVTGAGRGFCSGGDLNSSQVISDTARHMTMESREENLFHHMESVRLLHDMDKPAIAMINGPVAGAGIGIAGACDVRFASTDAVFKSAFLDVGLSGDYCATFFWTQILGARARDLFFSSEKLSAERAFEMGLYNRLYQPGELREQTLSYARKLAMASPAALKYLKRNLNAAEHLSIDAMRKQEAVHSVMSAKAMIDARARKS
ncbi:enoyl-CoA hydratase/isomerase family protein [Hyphomonas oceanitis]|uniref:enoyl-CoA hydratase/isomerase family protein n=1 Tax=Hyphomonas oceanitis TaxID=81033 RepID=UPI003002952A